MKKILIIVTLSITVAAVIKRVAELETKIESLDEKTSAISKFIQT